MGLRDEAKQKTREALIEAGMALIAEEGLDGPSLDAICARAGYTRGAFYVHFADRDDFLVAVMERAGGQFLDGVIGSGLGATVQRFVAAMASGAYPLTKRGGVRPYQLYDACARAPAIRARYVKLIGLAIDKLAVVVEGEQATGGLGGEVAPGDVASLLLALAIGAHTLLDLELPLDYPALARATLTLLTGGAGAARGQVAGAECAEAAVAARAQPAVETRAQAAVETRTQRQPQRVAQPAPDTRTPQQPQRVAQPTPDTRTPRQQQRVAQPAPDTRTPQQPQARRRDR